MCRSIKVLRTREASATKGEISAAALQFVRKVSGMRKPSKSNQKAFDAAVCEISGVVQQLLADLGQPRSRETIITDRPGQTGSAIEPVCCDTRN